MTPRLRMLAGPNSSGKSTLAKQLVDDYAVNLYKFLNADMLFAESVKSHKTACPFCCEIVRQFTYNSLQFRLFDIWELNISSFQFECFRPIDPDQILQL